MADKTRYRLKVKFYYSVVIVKMQENTLKIIPLEHKEQSSRLLLRYNNPLLKYIGRFGPDYSRTVSKKGESAIMRGKNRRWT
jgi:hypothetical protein